MKAAFRGGWITVPYSKGDFDKVEISAGSAFRSAYLDYDEDGNRIAQIRPPSDVASGSTVDVQLRINGQVINAGKLRIP
jgi:hypothetical protein